VESEPNEREWKCRYEREKAVANNIANSFSRVVELSTDAKGILADLAYLEITDYRAELTAPAGGDVETVDKLVRRFYKIPDGEELADWAYKLRNEITAALYIARQVERSKVPPPDEIHRDGYNKGVEAERERWEAAAGDLHDASKPDEFVTTDDLKYAIIRNWYKLLQARDALAALLASEGKGEEAEREWGAGQDALEEVE